MTVRRSEALLRRSSDSIGPSGLQALTLCWLAVAMAGCEISSAPAVPAAKTLRLAVTTSTRDSGLLEILHPDFKREYGAGWVAIAVGTGAALKLGEVGEVDAVLVHARAAEDAFLAAGHGIRRADVMHNTFEIVGPPSDPAGVRGLEPAAAFQAIAARGCAWVSRGDESGTHQREQQIWQAGGGRPNWSGYSESGQGQATTLVMADQQAAYTLCDRGTYLKTKPQLEIVPLVSGGPQLHNAYGVLVVNPDKHPHVQHHLAQSFVDFLLSKPTQQKIRDFTIHGEQLFQPAHLPETESR